MSSEVTNLVRDPSRASSTVRVTFLPDRLPESIAQATQVFVPYGELARVDMTLGSMTGCVLVTFFDVRAARQVLAEWGNQADLYPAALHDFRSVCIPATAFAQLPGGFTGFQTFGEIADVKVSGEEMIVEFFDMRAAQKATVVVPGCRAWQPSRQESNVDVATLDMNQVQNVPPNDPQVLPSPTLLRSLMDTLARMDRELSTIGSQPGFTEPQLGAVVDHPVAVVPNKDDAFGQIGDFAPMERFQADPMHLLPTAQRGPSIESCAAISPAAPEAVGTRPNEPGARGKPTREKLNSKDLTKFDIIPEHILDGRDKRATVMVRNVPKACSREDMIEVLDRFGLHDRYSFFYMPFDKRRNIHCGFAFLNFRQPEDVLKLVEGFKTFTAPSGATSTLPPVVSYARIQGEDLLRSHFKLSAIMHDSDARKRPVFVQGDNDSSKTTSSSNSNSSNSNSNSGGSNSNSSAGSNSNNNIGKSKGFGPGRVSTLRCDDIFASYSPKDMDYWEPY